MMSSIFVLLIVFQIKHFLADFPLQGRYMLGKFKAGWDFVWPLLAHVAVHGGLTLCIALAFGASIQLALGLALFDTVIHFVMDRIKAGPKYLGRYKPDQPKFWWSLGADQAVHHMTHYAIILALVAFV